MPWGELGGGDRSGVATTHTPPTHNSTQEHLGRYRDTLEADLALLKRAGEGGGGGDAECDAVSGNRLNAVRVVAGEKRVLRHLERMTNVATRHLDDARSIDAELSGVSYRVLLGWLLRRADLSAGSD